MTFEIGKYQVEIVNESEFNPDSKDNPSQYEKKYLIESDFYLPTKFGIRTYENGTELMSAIIAAEGGASGLHTTSQVIDSNRICICCGDSVFCLDLPALNLIWKNKVDTATAFEIFKINNGFIVHGEMEISRVDNQGNIVWQNGGADIFVTPDGKGDFELNNDFIKAIDWESRIYKWNLNGEEIK